jgi:hypothetical protein
MKNFAFFSDGLHLVAREVMSDSLCIKIDSSINHYVLIINILYYSLILNNS